MLYNLFFYLDNYISTYILQKETLIIKTMISYQENTHIYNLIQDAFNAKPEDIIRSLEAAKKKREYNRNYWQKHKDDPDRKQKTADSVREWQRSNRVHLAARHKARYENDPEYRNKLKEFRMKYYYQAKERAAARTRESEGENSENSGSIKEKDAAN